MINKCLNCGHQEFYTAEVLPGHQNALLAGVGMGLFIAETRFQIYVCDQCGHVHFFLPNKGMDKIRKSKKFTKYRASSN